MTEAFSDWQGVNWLVNVRAVKEMEPVRHKFHLARQ